MKHLRLAAVGILCSLVLAASVIGGAVIFFPDSALAQASIRTVRIGDSSHAGRLKIADGSANYVTFDPAAISADYTVTLPSATGTMALTSSALVPSSVAATGAISSSSATAGIGFATGAGGSVTQTTSATTGVTLNKVCGQVVTVTQNIAAAGEVTFTVTNSTVATTDVVLACLDTDSTSDGTPIVAVTAVGAGSFDITITNLHASAAEQGILTINFAVINGVTS